MKSDETKTTGNSSIIGGKQKFKFSKKNGRFIIVLIVVLAVIAALLYFKPSDTKGEITENVDFYSDIETNVPVFNNEDKTKTEGVTAKDGEGAQGEAEAEVQTASIEPTAAPTTESAPESVPEAKTASTAPVTENTPQALTTIPTATVGLAPDLAEENAPQTTPEAQTPSTELAPALDAFENDDIKNKEKQDKALTELFNNAKNGKTAMQEEQNINYEGKQLVIPYNEGEQIKIYLYKNFSVKVFLGKQPNLKGKDIKKLDYFINGSDNDDSYKLRLLPNNILLLSKNTKVENWGGTDLFVTAGNKNYTFILLNAPTPAERTDSIRYTTNTSQL
ncbi:hypothetical protein [Xenorhabdus sp. TH1]|uniref:hypothetical protein n=1 Tax=Xenorhabdus sp. TH1 TaxID=3130166 RepID=UPI0030D5F491